MIRRTGSPADIIDVLGTCALRIGDWLDRRAILVYGALSALVFVTSLFAIARFTIEADESWILMSTFKAFGLTVPGSQEIEFPTVTSGGLYFLIHGLVGIFTQWIAIHRAISMLFLASLVAIVFQTMRRRGAELRDAALASSLVLAAPGLILQSGLAMAEIIATALLLATALYWDRKGRLGLRGSALTGVLLGLTCATRTNCLVCLPVFFAFACFEAEDWARGISRGSAMLAAAIATYAIAVLGYCALFTIDDWHLFQVAFIGSTGAPVEKGLGQLLQSIFIAADFFPPFLIAALLGGIIACLSQGIDRLRLPLLLVALGIFGAAAWVVKAPIPHVRYAWPFTPLLFVAAGLLMHLTGLLTQTWLRLAMHLFAIGSVLQQMATSLVLIGTGDSLVAAYQVNRQAALVSPAASYSGVEDQRKMARAIAALPANADLITKLEPLGFPLTYLSGRRIRSALPWDPAREVPRYYVMTPGDYAVFHPGRPVIGWLSRNCVLTFRSGEYALFAVTGQEPFPPP